MKEISIVPIFNQAAPGVWRDFARIESTAPGRDSVDVMSYEYDWRRYGQCFAFGAYDAAQMVGFISGFVSNGIVRVQCLYMLPEYRGNKIGGQLLRRAETSVSLRARMMDLVALPGAMNFYKRAGYYPLDKMAENHLNKALPRRRGMAGAVPVFGDIAAFRNVSARLGIDDWNPHQPAFMYVDIDGNVNGVITGDAMYVVNKGPAAYVRQSLSMAMARYMNAVAARGATR